MSDRAVPRLRAIYAALVFIAFAVNYPGRAVPDTLGMFWMSRDISRLADWHEPTVTFIYALLDPFLGSPAGALLIQCALLMTWPAWVFCRIAGAPVGLMLKGIGLALWTAMVFVMIALAGLVIKDVLLVGGLSSLLLLLVHGRANPAFSIGAAALVLLAMVYSIRPTHAVVIAFVGLVFLVVDHGSAMRRAVPAVAFVGAAIATGAIFTWLLSPPIPSHPEDTLFTFDLAGMSVETGENLFVDLLGEATPEKDPAECYTPKWGNPYIWGECAPYHAAVTAEREGLARYWMTMILEHPLAYLRHRLAYVGALLQNDAGGNDGIVPPPPGYDLATNNATYIKNVPAAVAEGVQIWKPRVPYKPFGRVADAYFTSFLASPLLWTTICFAGMAVGAFALRGGGDPLLLLASSVGVGNFLMYAAIGPADDLRYMLPTWFASVVVIVHLAGIAVSRGWRPIATRFK